MTSGSLDSIQNWAVAGIWMLLTYIEIRCYEILYHRNKHALDELYILEDEMAAELAAAKPQDYEKVKEQLGM